MQAPEEMNRDYKRTTSEQLEFFVSFIIDHPQLLANKNDPTDPERIKNLWSELAETLNSFNGPVRSAAKWKETLSHWKNQLRSRARKAKVDKLVTGGGPPTKIKFKDFEERALEAFGAIAVDGLPDLPTLGLEPLVEILPTPIPTPIPTPTPSQTSDQFEYLDTEYLETTSFLSPSSSTFLNTPNRPQSSSVVGTQLAYNKKSHKSGSTSFELMKELLEMTKAREERDKATQDDNIRVQMALAESLKSLADSVRVLSEAVAKSSNRYP